MARGVWYLWFWHWNLWQAKSPSFWTPPICDEFLVSVSVACMWHENVSLSVSVTCLHFQIFMHVCVCSVSADKAQTTMSLSQIVCVCLTLIFHIHHYGLRFEFHQVLVSKNFRLKWRFQNIWVHWGSYSTSLLVQTRVCQTLSRI